jgi:flagellar basal body-associated protein FliL
MKTSKSSVFLFELMVIILVFTLAAAICTQIFVGAFKMSGESRELTMSSINAQTVAERFKSGEDDIEPVYFAGNWAEEDRDGAYYRIEIDRQDSNPKMRDAYVNVYKVGEEKLLYSIHVKEFAG